MGTGIFLSLVNEFVLGICLFIKEMVELFTVQLSNVCFLIESKGKVISKGEKLEVIL